MSKFVAFLMILILFGAVFYVYDLNTNDVGVKIDKLKLKYTIGENASPDKMLQFSQDLSDLATNSKDLDKKKLLFESKLWTAIGLSKEVALKIGSGENLTDNCNDLVLDLQNKIVIAKQSLTNAKTDFEFIKSNYTNVEQQDYNARFSNIEYSLQLSDDVLFITCPK